MDVALAGRYFFNLNYLRSDNSYDGDREQSDDLAEAAQSTDIDPNPQFLAADKYRAQSVAFIAMLIVLAASLWFFALSETIEHIVKYVTALGGLVFLLLGVGGAWAIEGGADLSEVYNTSLLISILAGVAITIGVVALLVLARIRKKPTAPIYEAYPSNAHIEEKDESGNEGFRRTVTMLIASVTLFAAIVGWLQADSGAKNDAAGRDQQRFAGEALGTDASGKALVNFQYGAAYHAVNELTVQAESAQVAGDSESAARYRALITETLKLSEQSPISDPLTLQTTPNSSSQLLASPYYDPKRRAAPDVAGYEADVYVTKRAELAERSSLAGDLNNAWENKANAYIVHLTLLAAALALFGLSLSFSGLARPLFVVVGSAITLVTFGSVVSVYAQPVTSVPDSAVQAYARGVGLTYRGDLLGAVSAFDDAVKQSPGYATALNARGDAHIKLSTTERLCGCL